MQIMNERVDAYIDEVWDHVLNDIAVLVAHPSVANASPVAPRAPYGRDVRAALDCVLGIAKRLGYEISDDEGYVGMADIQGESATQLATICHVDVVPAGPDWISDPWTMERRDGWLVGRGVIDDKGPAILSLYAGAFFLHEDMQPHWSLRALFGCDEEVGMSDVGHYLSGHPQPAFLFTPDATFPVCNAEKGIYGGSFISGAIEERHIVSWSGAEATNAIPGQSELILRTGGYALPAPVSNARRIELCELDEGEVHIFARGIGGHAAQPAGTINAIGLIVRYLLEVRSSHPDLLSDPEWQFIDLLSLVCADTSGDAVGIASSNEAFGPLTLNAGTISLRSDGRLEQTVDIRYPNSIDADTISARLRSLAVAYGASFEAEPPEEPFLTSADSPAVQALIATYNEVTGSSVKPFSMGGGTYARNFARAVSFGPEEEGMELPEWGGPMHGPNEVANEALLRRALKIYILALLRLQEVEL